MDDAGCDLRLLRPSRRPPAAAQTGPGRPGRHRLPPTATSGRPSCRCRSPRA
ncbi:hypothetical protein HBB16_11360 [Pseudonocardia sp. MCCB 268]|nr:hypothetical protein [Pseudonocardia cytotoxica]